MKCMKLFCVAVFAVSTAAAASFSQPQLPGRSVGQGEADSLKGGRCTYALGNQCGTGASCSGMLSCVKDQSMDGNNNPDGTNCTDDPKICTIFKTLGTCSQ